MGSSESKTSRETKPQKESEEKETLGWCDFEVMVAQKLLFKSRIDSNLIH